jgi:hypothetical protein
MVLQCVAGFGPNCSGGYSRSLHGRFLHILRSYEFCIRVPVSRSTSGSTATGFPCRDRLVDLVLLPPVRCLGIPSHEESYVLCNDVFVVNDSCQPLHTTIINDCRDVHSLCRVREAVTTGSTGRYRFSNIAGDNIPATILRDHWRYLPRLQHMFKVVRHVDGETINSPVKIHENNDIATQ